MTREDFSFLKFRTELIKLLGRYKLEMSGTGFDDGTVNFYDNRQGVYYILRNEIDDYEALKDTMSSWENISTDYIIDMFSEENNFIHELKNIGVFTNSKFKAVNFFDNLIKQYKDDIKQYRKSNDSEQMELILNDNTCYIWIKPIDGSRGYRVGKAYIDKNLTFNEIFELVAPICVYCRKKDIEII